MHIGNQGHHTHIHYHTHQYHTIILPGKQCGLVSITCTVNVGGQYTRHCIKVQVKDQGHHLHYHTHYPLLPHHHAVRQKCFYHLQCQRRRPWYEAKSKHRCNWGNCHQASPHCWLLPELSHNFISFSQADCCQLPGSLDLGHMSLIQSAWRLKLWGQFTPFGVNCQSKSLDVKIFAGQLMSQVPKNTLAKHSCLPKVYWSLRARKIGQKWLRL